MYHLRLKGGHYQMGVKRGKIFQKCGPDSAAVFQGQYCARSRWPAFGFDTDGRIGIGIGRRIAQQVIKYARKLIRICRHKNIRLDLRFAAQATLQKDGEKFIRHLKEHA